MNPSILARIATRRDTSLFADDCRQKQQVLSEALAGARVLVIGGAGSIGSSTISLLAGFDMAALHVVDQNENSLAELVRDLRGSTRPLRCRELRLLPLDFGSSIMSRFLMETEDYDYVLNFAAIKHVRSEKDTYSVLQMLETNVLHHARLLSCLSQRGSRAHYFSVSTDKAANPVNLMGASKRLMEAVMFSGLFGTRTATSARFANVAFSDGSLLSGWRYRLQKRQPLAVPRDTRRFFVSLEEAGEICGLAALVVPKGYIAIPALSASTDLHELEAIAVEFLDIHGYRASLYSDTAAAIADLEKLTAEKRYPLILTPLDTAGEKPYEEFVGDGEVSTEIGLKELRAIPAVATNADSLRRLVESISSMIDNPQQQVTKSELVALVNDVLPHFAHAKAAESLDNRL